jgi:hypothetical protein
VVEGDADAVRDEPRESETEEVTHRRAGAARANDLEPYRETTPSVAMAGKSPR